ncbi:glutamate--tRNA ligase family protein [Bacteriovoracaceae bacterium]|nr:glutamate--tRNA ligase family protein [Bacteriovoracaceae bacterium]
MTSHTRIAPTPSGIPHLGNAINFAIIHIISRIYDTKLSLRIDDADTKRFRNEYLESIFSLLNWLEIDTEGPKSVTQFHQDGFSQTHRFQQYKIWVEELLDKKLAYCCNCSRKDILNRTGGMTYDGFCQSKEIAFHSKETTVRIQDQHFILWTKEDSPSYQLVSTWEDCQNDVDLIIRGNDLKESSGFQCHLAKLLNQQNFCKVHFFHHSLILDSSGEKLSKSSGKNTQSSIISWDQQLGTTRTDLYYKAAQLLFDTSLSKEVDILKQIDENKNNFKKLLPI